MSYTFKCRFLQQKWDEEDCWGQLTPLHNLHQILIFCKDDGNRLYRALVFQIIAVAASVVCYSEGSCEYELNYSTHTKCLVMPWRDMNGHMLSLGYFRCCRLMLFFSNQDNHYIESKFCREIGGKISKINDEITLCKMNGWIGMIMLFYEFSTGYPGYIK